MENRKLGFIGAGNMAQAIILGILDNKILRADQIMVSDFDECKLQQFASIGVTTTKSNIDVAKSCSALLFAVKPQIAPTVFAEIKDSLKSDIIISIMAGVSITKLHESLGKRCFVRIMPNTPLMVKTGMSAICKKNYLDCDIDTSFVDDIFSSLGKVVKVEETDFDAVTSISGSGPAYVYSFIKAMIDGGIDGNLDKEVATTLTLQTILGAVAMVEQNNDIPIETLISNVCSKGGTTIEAINSFENDNLNMVVRRGIEKCKARSTELSRQ